MSIKAQTLNQSHGERERGLIIEFSDKQIIFFSLRRSCWSGPKGPKFVISLWTHIAEVEFCPSNKNIVELNCYVFFVEFGPFMDHSEKIQSTRGTEQPRPRQTRGAISASLEDSDLPTSGSSRGLQQRARERTPPRSRARAEASNNEQESVLRHARGLEPRPPAASSISASLEGSDLPSSGSSRGLQQRA